jgi:hypothetical protein
MKMPRLITLLFSALSVDAVLAEEIDFKKVYSAFGEAPAADVRPVAEKLVAVPLKDFELDADNVLQAYEGIKKALQAADYPYGLSLIMKNSDEKNYKSPIKIPKTTRNLGEIINLLCEQADLVWDFSALKLTFTPKNAEVGADEPATAPQLEPSGNENPNPESKPRSQ